MHRREQVEIRNEAKKERNMCDCDRDWAIVSPHWTQAAAGIRGLRCLHSQLPDVTTDGFSVFLKNLATFCLSVQIPAYATMYLMWGSELHLWLTLSASFSAPVFTILYLIGPDSPLSMAHSDESCTKRHVRSITGAQWRLIIVSFLYTAGQPRVILKH